MGEEVAAAQGGGAGRKNARAEKKMRDALMKSGMKRVDNVNQVVLRKGSQSWQFLHPEAYQLDNVLVVFGDPSAHPDHPVHDTKGGAGAADVGPVQAPPTKIVEDPEDVVDTTGLPEQDIVTVMQQANVTKRQAVDALRESGGDLVAAVMKLAL